MAKSAAGIRKAVPLMAGFARKLLTGEPIGTPEDEQYPQGQACEHLPGEERRRACRGYAAGQGQRASPYKTELEISTYEKVEPSAPIADLSKAKIAPLHHRRHGPHGQPRPHGGGYRQVLEGVPLWRATSWRAASGSPSTPASTRVYANNDPNRVAPYDMLKMLEKEGIIGSVYPALISTTGNSTSVADSTRMGQEIAERLVSAGVNGVILTST